MKCKLQENKYTDSNFEIRFTDIDELENLRNSLTSMIKYFRMCQEDGEELPELVYRIKDKKND